MQEGLLEVCLFRLGVIKNKGYASCVQKGLLEAGRFTLGVVKNGGHASSVLKMVAGGFSLLVGIRGEWELCIECARGLLEAHWVRR